MKTDALRNRELSEALEQQRAAFEVLQVIPRSPGELEPVFQVILAHATRLCEATYGAIWLKDGDCFRNAAFHGALSAEYVEKQDCEVKKLRQLEEEDARLRKVVADLTLDKEMAAGGDPPQTMTPARGR